MPTEGEQGDARATVVAAEHLVDLQRPDEALTMLAPVLRSDPEHHLAHAVACRAQLARGRPDLAEEHARVVTRRLDDPFGPYLLTLVHVARKTPGAVEAAREAIRRAPERSIGHRAMVNASINDRAAVGRARSAAQAAIERAPDDPDVLALAALAWMYNGRPWVRPWDRRTARRHLEAALALDPGHVRARHELAMLDALGGRPVASIRGLGGVLRTDPLHQSTHDRLRLVLARLTWRCHLCGFVLLFVLEGLRDASGAQRVAQWVLGGVAVAVLCWMAHGIRIALGGGSWSALRSWVVTERAAAGWSALVVAGLVAVAAGALAPPGSGQGAVTAAWTALLGGVVVSWMRSRA